MAFAVAAGRRGGWERNGVLCTSWLAGDGENGDLSTMGNSSRLMMENMGFHFSVAAGVGLEA